MCNPYYAYCNILILLNSLLPGYSFIRLFYTYTCDNKRLVNKLLCIKKNQFRLIQ